MIMNKAKSILKNKFGYNEFRSFQENVISNVLTKKDTIAIMPTGGGKSLCYQIPALLFPGITVVISPLISLMKDQVEQLGSLNIEAVFLNSSLRKKEYNHNMGLVRDGRVKLLYCAPETFMIKATQKLLSEVRVDCITIDEAHCVSEWGHDFRPEYMRISETRDRFPHAVFLALTATATAKVQKDIVSSLGLKEFEKFIASFDRPNLFLQIVPKVDPLRQTLDFLRTHRKKPGIIYCFKRKQVEQLCEGLQENGYIARAYHAGLADKEREKNQEQFLKDEVQIIVATIAFGMGINKANVRFVIHYDLPKSIESYYQEIGRAGRDGLRSDCLLLFSYTDIAKFKFLLKKKEDKERSIAEKQIDALVEYLEFQDCRRIPLLKYFGEDYEGHKCETMCDNCNAQSIGETDISSYAYKYLFCIQETKQRFNLSYITSVLRGVKNDKVFDNKHEDLRSYNTGKSLLRNQWSIIARQLVVLEYIEKDEKETLKLTSKGSKFIRNLQPIKGRLTEEPEEEIVLNSNVDIRQIAIDELTRVRKEISDNQGLPPYAVVSDQSLKEIAESLPENKQDFLDVIGITEFKYKKYGNHFIDVISRIKRENGVARSNSDDMRNQPDSNKFIQIGEKYNKGVPIREIAHEFDLQYTLILDNLYHFIQSGGKLNKIEWLAQRILGKETLEKITEAYDTMGCHRLEYVYDHLGGKVNMDQLKIIRLYYLNEN